MQEKSLRLLFLTRDLSVVKQYLRLQWTKILCHLDKVPISDFIFSKQVKLNHYRGQPPPGAEVCLDKI
jgi:DNA polymerase zeta